MILKIISSLKLTVWLLVSSLVLVFFGTLDQVHFGIRATQIKYFESLIALWQYPLQWPLGESLHWIHFPMPGGYLIGPLLLINLIAAHITRFVFKWNRAGIFIIHLGLIFLLLGQLITQLLQEENYMWVKEGESANYLESHHYDELVIKDVTHRKIEGVVSIPIDLIDKRPTSLQHPRLPFRVETKAFYPNAAIIQRSNLKEKSPQMIFNRGLGREKDYVVWDRPMTYIQDERNVTTAIVELVGSGGSLGIWLVSNVFDEQFSPQYFSFEEREYEIALRIKRTYLPYKVELIDFSHDRYMGTDIPKNFSSKVRIINRESTEDRQTLIYMNHPLRYKGRTFYQAAFDQQTEKSSMFQVVNNPGWLIPYISCGMIAIGLIYQFGYRFIRFSGNKNR